MIPTASGVKTLRSLVVELLDPGCHGAVGRVLASILSLHKLSFPVVCELEWFRNSGTMGDLGLE